MSSVSPPAPPPHHQMSSYKISELKSKDEITALFLSHAWNDESWLIKLNIKLLPEFDITEKQLNNHHLDHLSNSISSAMDLSKILDDNDYHQSVHDARQIKHLDKSPFCLNFYYVFYAELEINLNRFFIGNLPEQWSLLFVDYNFMPPIHNYDINMDADTTVQLFSFQSNILTILHNAKIKYRCSKCRYEWTSARGRVIFQAETPERNKYNVLFAYLFTQKCQICRQETEPSWYLDEATRVMKNVCRILMNKFYSERQFSLPPSSPSSSSEEEYVQRSSDMKNLHHQDLCRACQEGSCYGSHRRYKRRK